MIRTNLVVACWGGPRRTPHCEYEADRAYYLKAQLDSLEKFKHNLSQITFVSTGGDSQGYFDCLKLIARQYALIEREDIGMSYGSFNAAWQADRSFDYYIFLEDDYVFMKDNFDVDMINCFNSIDDCGYLCQLAWGRVIVHPAVFNGIASNECLRRLDVLPGSHEFSDDNLLYYGQVESNGQRAWGDRVARVGLKVKDMGRRFKAPFIESGGSLICWHPEAPEYIIVPVQIYEDVLKNPAYALEYVATDEDWRTFQLYYFGLRNVYLNEESRAFFTANVLPGRMKTREDLARGVSTYENALKMRRYN